jgi:hypothetical protein
LKKKNLKKLSGSVADPDPFDLLTSGSGIRNGQKLGSGSGMNNPNHISESLETVFGLKYLNSLMRIRDLGWKKFESGICEGKNSHPGSATLHSGSVDNFFFYPEWFIDVGLIEKMCMIYLY